LSAPVSVLGAEVVEEARWMALALRISYRSFGLSALDRVCAPWRRRNRAQQEKRNESIPSFCVLLRAALRVRGTDTVAPYQLIVIDRFVQTCIAGRKTLCESMPHARQLVSCCIVTMHPLHAARSWPAEVACQRIRCVLRTITVLAAVWLQERY